MKAVAILDDQRALLLSIVAWDQEYYQRVFAAAEIESSLFTRLWDAFSQIEPPRGPLWYPLSGGSEQSKITIDASMEIDASMLVLQHRASEAQYRYVMQSSDLTGSIDSRKLDDSQCIAVEDLVKQSVIVDIEPLTLSTFLTSLIK